MTIQQAQAAIGQPFKVKAITSGALAEFDTILHVDAEGIVYGEFIEAHCEDCRLKDKQPAHLQR